MSEKGRQGFASMPPDRVKAIAAHGGRTAQARGTGHKWDTAEASVTGRKGGLTRQAKWRERFERSINEGAQS